MLRLSKGTIHEHLGIGQAGARVNDLVNVPVAQPVLVAILNETPRSIDQENALARGGAFLIKHDDAGRDAGPIEDVGW